MILDALLLLSGAVSAAGVLSGQAVNTAGTFLSTNTIDVGSLALGGNQAGDMGAGEGLYFAFSVLTAPTVGTTVTFQIIHADDAALTSNVQVINQTDAIPIASLPIGTVVPLRWDPAAPYVPKRYIGARYINVGAIATFSVTCEVVKDIQAVKNRYYNSGFAIL